VSDQTQLVLADDVLMQIEQLSPEQQESLRQVMNERAIAKQLDTLAAGVQLVRSESEERDRQLREDLKKALDAGNRRMKGADNYYAKSILGKAFQPMISAPRMTKLLRVVGILNSFGDPYARYRIGAEALAKIKPWSEFETWLFHAAKTRRRIDAWLDEHGQYEAFHFTATKEERDACIDMLCEVYIR